MIEIPDDDDYIAEGYSYNPLLFLLLSLYGLGAFLHRTRYDVLDDINAIYRLNIE